MAKLEDDYVLIHSFTHSHSVNAMVYVSKNVFALPWLSNSRLFKISLFSISLMKKKLMEVLKHVVEIKSVLTWRVTPAMPINVHRPKSPFHPEGRLDLLS